MEVFIIKKQSESDVITNSSSEVFIMHTDKSLEEISNILHSFTSGFQEPIKFDLEAYKKALKEKEKEDEKNEQKSPEYWNTWGYATPYGIAEDYFTDFSDEYAMARRILERLWYIDLPNRLDLEGAFNIDFGCTASEYKNFLYPGEEEKLNSVKKWIEFHTKKNLKELLTSHKYFYEVYDLKDLDGAIMLISEDDNSIPYEDFYKIESLFDAYHIHLG